MGRDDVESAALIGLIDAVNTTAAGREFRIRCRYGDLLPGESIAVSGACLTARECGPHWFTAAAVVTTLGRTTMDDWAVGRNVNLERALRAGGASLADVVKVTIFVTDMAANFATVVERRRQHFGADVVAGVLHVAGGAREIELAAPRIKILGALFVGRQRARVVNRHLAEDLGPGRQVRLGWRLRTHRARTPVRTATI